MIKKVFKIDGMHCASCAMNIDGDLEDFVSGVTSAKTNYARQECAVEFEGSEGKLEEIVEQIKKSGYEAEVVGEKK